VDINRNTASIIPHGHAFVFVNGDSDPIAFPGQGFINRVVNYLVDQVMQRFDVRTANVHTRAAADCFQPFQDLDIACVVVFLFFHVFLQMCSER